MENRISLLGLDPYYNQRVQQKVRQFYQSNGFQTQWLYDNSPGTLYHEVVEAFKNASHYGLFSADYDVARIEERLNFAYANRTISMIELIDLDIYITEMYFLFTTHLQEGKVRNVQNGKNVWMRPNKEYSTADVAKLLETVTPEQFWEGISKLQPASEQYIRLQKALDHYRSLEKAAPGTPLNIFVNGSIKPNERNSAIPLIRRKLSLTSLMVYPVMLDSITGHLDSVLYDQNLVDAIRLFQLRHGLEADGIIGEKTVKFLNQSFREKADVIALNMERMRWLPDNNDENYILVNIPEYKLRVYASQKLELEMKVIVGAVNKATPVFSDVLEYIVFNPTWTVPVSIIKEEIIPQAEAGSGILFESELFLL